jgi:hypothetical protein
MPEDLEPGARLEGTPHARLDPWCLVPFLGADCLFGFAIYHNGTGGLSWMRSSGVAYLDETLARARTESGRLYELGRRTAVADLQGPEAWAALYLLVKTPSDFSEEAQLLGAWLTTCKMARWLGLPPPSRNPVEVRQFLAAHGEAYRSRWSRRGP